MLEVPKPQLGPMTRLKHKNIWRNKSLKEEREYFPMCIYCTTNKLQKNTTIYCNLKKNLQLVFIHSITLINASIMTYLEKCTSTVMVRWGRFVYCNYECSEITIIQPFTAINCPMPINQYSKSGMKYKAPNAISHLTHKPKDANSPLSNHNSITTH